MNKRVLFGDQGLRSSFCAGFFLLWFGRVQRSLACAITLKILIACVYSQSFALAFDFANISWFYWIICLKNQYKESHKHLIPLNFTCLQAKPSLSQSSSFSTGFSTSAFKWVQTFVLFKIGFANTFKLIQSLKELVLLCCYLWPFVLSLQCFCLYWHEYLHGQTVNQIRELIRVETNPAWKKKLMFVLLPTPLFMQAREGRWPGDRNKHSGGLRTAFFAVALVKVFWNDTLELSSGVCPVQACQEAVLALRLWFPGAALSASCSYHRLLWFLPPCHVSVTVGNEADGQTLCFLRCVSPPPLPSPLLLSFSCMAHCVGWASMGSCRKGELEVSVLSLFSFVGQGQVPRVGGASACKYACLQILAAELQ